MEGPAQLVKRTSTFSIEKHGRRRENRIIKMMATQEQTRKRRWEITSGELDKIGKQHAVTKNEVAWLSWVGKGLSSRRRPNSQCSIWGHGLTTCRSHEGRGRRWNKEGADRLGLRDPRGSSRQYRPRNYHGRGVVAKGHRVAWWWSEATSPSG